MPRPLRIILTLAAALALPAPAFAQSGGQSVETSSSKPATKTASKPTKRDPSAEERSLIIQLRAFKALNEGKLDQAEKLLRQAIATDDANFVFYYNLACVLDLEHHPDQAAASLLDAIEHGFVDLIQLQRDPQLQGARADPRIKALLEHWPTVLSRQLDANLKAAGALFDGTSGKYETTRDERLRIAVMSAMDPQATEQAHADIARLYDWAVLNVFPDLDEADKKANDAWSAVILPTPRDFERWLVITYGGDALGGGFAGIGGSYTNDLKRLVARDLGATLRHEFFHVLHWRDMTRRGQEQPIWIQEGLCSLVEDYDLGDGQPASLKPAPSWRTNMAQRMLGGNLLPLKQFVSVPRDRFTGASPLAHYAQARTFFLYLFTSGHLKDWYTTYTTDPKTGYAADPTGLKSIEAVFGKPIADVDKDFRTWLRKLPKVAEQDRQGPAGLGVDVEEGKGDGPEIVDIPRDTHSRPNSARQAGLRVGDVIQAIDGSPTRDLNELVRLLGQHKPGDTVEISYRRGTTHGKATVKLGDQ